MSNIIVMGGKNGVRHVVGNKTNYQLDRFEKWFTKDSKRAVEDTLGGSTNRTKKELLETLIKNFKLGMTCTQFLGFLHEQIVQIWLNAIDTYIANNPEKARQIEFQELTDDQPPNYTAGMARIKNMRFTGFNHDAIKGFCPLEPLVRLEQLLDFPIEVFDADLNIADFADFGTPPAWPIGIVQINTPEEAKREILNLKPELQKWEQYYDNLCHSLLKLCAKLAFDEEKETN